MKKLINYFFVFLTFILSISSSFNKQIKLNEIKTNNIKEVNDKENFNFSNLIVFAKFQGESEFVSSSDKTGLVKLVDDTFNNSNYSLKSYINSISNNHIRMKYLYLFDEGGGSITLNKKRGYYAEYSTENPEGYRSNSEKTQRMEYLKIDWADRINELLIKNASITDYDSTGNYSYNDLDRYGYTGNPYEKYIDNITIIFKKSNDVDYSYNWGDPLTTYHDKNNRVYYDLGNSKTLQSNDYVQVFLDYDYKYKVDGDIDIISTSVVSHETCHAIGLYDLYNSTSNQSPVGYMSILGKKIGPIGQFITAKERDKLGFLSSSNLIEIKNDGKYTINLTKDTYQDEVIVYKINLPSKKELYFEYRSFSSSFNRFDNLKKKMSNQSEMSTININDGLIVSRVNFVDNALSNLNVKNENWVFEVLGGSPTLNYTKTDSALNLNNTTLSTDSLIITVLEQNDEQLTFNVVGLPKVKIDEVTFNNPKVKLKRGESVKYDLNIKGENIEYATIKYSISLNNSKNTFVDYFGNLKISDDETSSKIILTANVNDVIKDLEISVDTSCKHELYYYSRVEPTCTSKGNIEYYRCAICNKYFSDGAAINEISYNSTILEELGHIISEFIVDKEPTYNSVGHRYKKCLRCNQILEEEDIPKKDNNNLNSSVTSSSISLSNSISSSLSMGNEISYKNDNNSLLVILLSVFIPLGLIFLGFIIYFFVSKKTKK